MPRTFDIICGVIKHRINTLDKAMMLLIMGEMGSGKSLAAVAIADKVDPTFQHHKTVVYTVDEFMEALINSKKGQAIIFDEVGVNVAARDFATVQNKIMSIITQILRYKNVCCIFTTPNARFVDINVRESMNAIMLPKKIDKAANINICKYRILDLDDEGKVVRRQFKYFDGTTGAAGEIIDPVYVPRPDQDLEDYYLKISIKMKNDKMQELIAKMRGEDAEGEPIYTAGTKGQQMVLDNKLNMFNRLLVHAKKNYTWDEMSAICGMSPTALKKYHAEAVTKMV